MRLLTGDECGVLKECLPFHKKEKISCLPSAAARRKGVVSLDWTDNGQDSLLDKQFASLHLDSTVTLWERSNEAKQSFAKYHSVRDISNVFADCAISELIRPLGLASISGDRLVACNTLGQATILKPLAPEPVVQRFTTISVPENTKDQSDSIPLLTCMAVDAPSQRLALGGNERETTIYDIQSTKQLFKTKNLPPDPQTLLAPLVWHTCIQFMGDDGNTFAVGTAHHQVRVYDTRVARRPVLYTPDDLLEYRVTALCHDKIQHEHELFVGDAAGTIVMLDLRSIGRGTSKTTPLRYVGPGGSIRGLAVANNKLAAIGLDRMLHLYDIATTKKVECLYLKHRTNCLLLGQEAWKTEEDDLDDGDIDQEDVVRDYVDSDQEDDDSDDGDDDDQETAEESNEDDESQSSSDKEQADSGDDDDEVDPENSDGDGSSSSEESDRSGEDESEDDEPPKIAPRKRQKR